MDFLGCVGVYPFSVFGLIGNLVLICDMIVMLPHRLAIIKGQIMHFPLIPRDAQVVGLEKLEPLLLSFFQLYLQAQ